MLGCWIIKKQSYTHFYSLILTKTIKNQGARSNNCLIAQFSTELVKVTAEDPMETISSLRKEFRSALINAHMSFLCFP